MAKISVKNVSLNYPIFDASSRSLKQAVIRQVGGQINQTVGRVSVQALSDVSFDLNEGERLGLLGHNGAGKTTLLKVLSGIYEPSEGTLEVHGTRSSMTDVTMGMDADATGRENIRLRSIFLGMTFAEAKRLQPEIERFTELGEYLDLPIRTYSTGMLVRLGFAVSTALSPEILLMDEMIGAGDRAFAEKAKARVERYVSGASILVLASHNTGILREFCSKGLLLARGRVLAFGDIESIIAEYERAELSS
jgi:ABC-type polysaccharide/polyol phosphate transport system ATPase subunit